MKPKSSTPEELRLRARVIAPLVAFFIMISAAILGTTNEPTPPLPRVVSFALAADKQLGDAQTLNQPFAFFLTDDPHRRSRGFVLIVPRERKTPDSVFTRAIQEEIARNQPTRIQKALPDDTLATELVADPAAFPLLPLPNGTAYWKTDAGNVFLISGKDSYTLTNDPAVLINPDANRVFQKLIKARPKRCRTYLHASAKDVFPPKGFLIPIPTMSLLIKRNAEHVSQESYGCSIWG